MPAQPLPSISAAPVRSSPSTFSSRHDAMVTSYRALMTGLNTRKTYLEALASTPTPAWSSGASYTAGESVYSTVTWKTYRAKTTHSGEAIDPSSDTTNWLLTSGLVGSDQTKLDLITITRSVDVSDAHQAHFFVADGSVTAGEVVVLTSAGKVKSVTPSPTDADDWLGLAVASVGDGETVEVTLLFGVNLSQTSLTPKAKYYVSDDGTLTTSSASGRPIGKALSSTALLITEGNA